MNGPLHDPDVRRTWIALADAAQTVATPCRETARDLWHADHVDDRSVAAGLCAACPLLTPCGQYADRAEETHGVWGGRELQTQRRTRDHHHREDHPMTAAPGVNATRHEATTVDPGTEGPRAQTFPRRDRTCARARHPNGVGAPPSTPKPPGAAGVGKLSQSQNESSRGAEK